MNAGGQTDFAIGVEPMKKNIRLTMLGTGSALVTECYNTCFLLDDDGQLFLTDGGGGNTIMHQIRAAGYDWMDIRHIFVTHRHLDHLMGIVWLIRSICRSMAQGEYPGEAFVYSHKEVIGLIRELAEKLYKKKEAAQIDQRLHLVKVADGETRTIIGHSMTFFDMHSTKEKQFGYRMEYGDGKRLICCGDEPLNSEVESYAYESDWLLHETFCLHSQAALFDPTEKNHSTVRNVCMLGERLGVKNLLLYHTEDSILPRRKELYRQEGSQYYHGNLWIPDDLESIALDAQ